MNELTVQRLQKTGPSSLDERLVNSLLSLESLLAKLRSAASAEEIWTITLEHLKPLIPFRIAGIFCPKGTEFTLALEDSMASSDAEELKQVVDQAIDAGVFGWALQHNRLAAFKTPDGRRTLVLAALKTRQRLLGMFTAILSTQSASGWDANTIVLTTHLACAASALLADELANELQQQNRNLDALVQQRTAQLRQAKEEAELANRAKSAFFASASHELRTPLNAILGYTQILLGGDSLEEEHRSQVDTIHKSAEHLLGLINDVLEISRAESSAVEIVPVPLRLAQLVGEVADIVRPKAEAKGIHFQCTIDDAAPTFVNTDGRRLTQVLQNLLGNAIKFTEAGSVCMDVSRKESAVRFLVMDTGRGISPEALKTLFQPFQQANPSRGATSSPGLGLTISKKILEMMGAQLQLRSDGGKGSCFWFDLPCGAAATATVDEPTSPIESPPLSETALSNLKNYATRGDVLALREELEKMQRDPAGAPKHVTRVLQLTLECKMKAVRELLNSL